MFRLTMVLFAVVGTTLAGIGVVIALSLGRYDVMSIVVGAAIGAVIGLPASWAVARGLIET